MTGSTTQTNHGKVDDLTNNLLPPLNLINQEKIEYALFII